MSEMRKNLAELRRLAGVLNDANFLYHIEKCEAAYNMVLTHYARFKVGDRIQLARTPVITEQNAPGWMGSKHFLVKGARGTVTLSDIYPDRGALHYGITFDVESYLDSKGETHLIENRHVYTFGEDMLEPLGE